MAIETSTTIGIYPAIAAPRLTYTIFGLTVESDFQLPSPETTGATVSDPDVCFVLGEPCSELATPRGTTVMEKPCYCPLHNGELVMTIHRHEGHAWVFHSDAGTCHIAADGKSVTVFPIADTTATGPTLSLLLAGLVSTFVLHFRGFPCLHSSAVVSEHGVVAFLGPKGQGKSTMAAGLIRRGSTLLTDDILPLHVRDTGVHGLPSLPIMKLWGQSVEHALEIDDNLPILSPDFQKKLFTLDERFTFARDPERLRAIYVLDRYDPDIAGHTDVTISQLSQREALAMLLAQTTLRTYLMPQELAAFIPVYTSMLAHAPVRIVSFPNGFDHQDMVHERLLVDVGKISSAMEPVLNQHSTFSCA